jgi:hypothetical protein
VPTQIHNPRLSSRERYFARQGVNRLGNQTRQLEVVTAPWLGWVPDLPVHMVGWKGYRSGRGFVPIPYGTHGLILRHDDGYERIGATSLTGLTSMLTMPPPRFGSG